MHAILNRLSRVLLVSLSPLLLVSPSPAHADIFQWEYINPADPSQGKQQSTTLAPDGAGVDAVPGANLRGRNLNKAYLNGANLTDASFGSISLVRGVIFVETPSYVGHVRVDEYRGATLFDADFTGAEVRGADFSRGFCPPGTLCAVRRFGSGIALEQLYSTASYQQHNLTGVGLTANFLNGGNFAGQNLTNATFAAASLTDADFTGAEVGGASFSAIGSGTGITIPQLYSTANYQARDLNEISLAGNDLSDGNFAGLSVTNTDFTGATLTGADFTGAIVQRAIFDVYRYHRIGVIHDQGTGITLAQLYSTDSYQTRDLSGVGLARNKLKGGNFAGQNLANANFNGATLTGADFADSVVHGASFDPSYRDLHTFVITGTGISLSQLYSTASYQVQDLNGVNLAYHEFAGGNFAGQNLANANFAGATLTDAHFGGAILTGAAFYGAMLTGADFSGADARGTFFGFDFDFAGVITTNLVKSDGHIDGLELDGDERLTVRDYDGAPHDPELRIPTTIDQHLAMGPGGTLRMVFEADAWDSTISFAPGIPVTLGGTLELTFADDVNLASHVGRTLKIFDWTGVNPTGAFTVSSPYAWDLSNLYTTGQVTLTAIPEPATFALTIVGTFGVASYRRRNMP